MYKKITENVLSTLIATAILSAGGYGFYYLQQKIEKLENTASIKDIKNVDAKLVNLDVRLKGVEGDLNSFAKQYNTNIDSQIKELEKQPRTSENQKAIQDLQVSKFLTKKEVIEELKKWKIDDKE